MKYCGAKHEKNIELYSLA